MTPDTTKRPPAGTDPAPGGVVASRLAELEAAVLAAAADLQPVVASLHLDTVLDDPARALIERAYLTLEVAHRSGPSASSCCYRA